MSKNIFWLTAACFAVGLTAASNAFATNGYYTHGTGTKNKSMAGAGIALPEDAIDATNNPAVATEVGDQFVIGAALFSPIRKYQTTESMANGQCSPGRGCAITIGPNNIKSDKNYFVIPHLAWSKQLENDSAFALAFYGRGGMNTTWKGGMATFDPDGPGTDFDPMTFPGTYGAGDAGVEAGRDVPPFGTRPLGAAAVPERFDPVDVERHRCGPVGDPRRRPVDTAHLPSADVDAQRPRR